MKNRIKHIVFASALLSVASFQSCSLDEVNLGGFTVDAVTENSVESYEKLVNNCYFGMQRAFYGAKNWMFLVEADTDLWTFQGNQSNTWTEWFWFFGKTSPKLSYTNDYWNNTYDGIGACNLAIAQAPKAPYESEEARKAKVAEAHFMRAVYYFNGVEQFGGLTMITAPADKMDFAPTRTEPLTIYREVIIPDLQFAVQYLPKGDHNTTSIPTKKAALGFLAKACLQTYEYGSTEFLTIGLDAAKALIADDEAGGVNYNAHLYPDFADVFAEANNYTNKEALWKHRWISGDKGHGSSNGAEKANMNDSYFLCKLSRFGARVDDQATRLTWEGSAEGQFMPTQRLLSLFVESDGSLDPRFAKSFVTEWKNNADYTWDGDAAHNFGKDASVVGQSFTKAAAEVAIKFIMPQEADYAAWKARKATDKALIVDYADVYDDANKNVKMQYNGGENNFRYIYPSLSKHNSSNYYTTNASKKRNANLNATFIMRMAEVYLIAAELDVYLNGGAHAKDYVNKVRNRAGAIAWTHTPTVDDILDERARELCGEYCRFYDLKRTGKLKDASYLNEHHPDLGECFRPEYAVRPIPEQFTATISNGDAYQNPGY